MNSKALSSSTLLTKLITIVSLFYLLFIFSLNAEAQHKITSRNFSGFYISTGAVLNATQYIYGSANGGFETGIPTQHAHKIQPFFALGYERLWQQHYYIGVQLETLF